MNLREISAILCVVASVFATSASAKDRTPTLTVIRDSQGCKSLYWFNKLVVLKMSDDPEANTVFIQQRRLGECRIVERGPVNVLEVVWLGSCVARQNWPECYYIPSENVAPARNNDRDRN